MNDEMPQWMRALMGAVNEIVLPTFVGQIEINIFKGAISHVNLKQSYKDPGR